MQRLLGAGLVTVLAAALTAAGCGQLAQPAPYGSCVEPAAPAQPSRTAACIVAAPLFRPDFRAGVRLDEMQRVKITFSKEAVSEGAPEESLNLVASIIVKGDSISATFSALNRPFWRISATPATTAESRHPLLSPRLSAKGLIRDLTFMYWPVKSIEASLAMTCPDCRLSTSGSTRTLTRNGQRVLESQREGGAVILRNYPEGYELSIAADNAG